jgi:hypothetical protein
MPNKHRSEDEVTLHILDLHEQNLKPEQIAKVLGMSPRSVRQRIARVITEDCLHDPEAEQHWKGPR